MSVLISVVIDEGSNLRGYLAIDSTVNGRCYGGLRMLPDLSPDFLARAARVMTLKYGFLGLPLGGAKAGIVADPEMPTERKRGLLKAFGQALMPFLKTRSYVPGADMGTTGEDIRFMLTSIGLRVPRRSLTGRSGFYTSLSVLAAATRAAQHIGLDLDRASLAIEGFGSVGSSLAREFWERGVRVVAISTSQGALYAEKGLDIGELLRLYHQVGSKVVKVFRGAEQLEESKLLELEVDLLSPCAIAYSINLGNADQVRAKIICPGANLPVTPEADRILFQKGIISLPDFVANCGGVLGASMESAGLRESYIRNFIDQRIGQKVGEVIEATEKENAIPREYAERITEQRFLEIKERAENRGMVNKAFDTALELYRKGLIPTQLVGLISPRYFGARLGRRSSRSQKN